MNVLLVDDEEDLRSLLSAELRADGWDVLCAPDAESAWDLIARQKTHLVVCDWILPGLDGLELCRRVRALRGASYVYFILMTGARLKREDGHEAMRAGIDDLLIKPLDLTQLSLRLRAAQRVLAYANRLRELEGVIPICSYCRRLRDEKDCYDKMEKYFLKHAGVLFSHGVCPECLARHFPEEAVPPAG